MSRPHTAASRPTSSPEADTQDQLKPEAGDPRPAATRRTRLRVRYAETDRMGVVYYANYLIWFEVGRTEWLRQAGWTYRELERDGISLPVSRLTASTVNPHGTTTRSRSRRAERW